MIVLHKATKRQTDYKQWLRPAKTSLMAKLQAYRKDKKKEKDWITQANREKIQAFLFPTSSFKCAYCERLADILEIDHFYPKDDDLYADKAFDFNNLLPCCKKCNSVKGKRFEANGHEIIDPYVQRRLKQHLSLNTSNLKLTGTSGMGAATIEVMARSLNVKVDTLGKRRQTALFLRKEIARNMKLSLEKLEKKKDNHELVVYGLTELLDKILPSKAFTAVRASLLLHHPLFIALMAHLKSECPAGFTELQKMASHKKRYCLAVTAN